MQTRFQWSEVILDGNRMLRRYVRSVRGFSPYATAWQAALTGGLEEPICQRTNTNLSALYLFLACTRPPDFDTDRTTKTRIAWQLQSNEGILLRLHLRATKRPTPQKMRKTSAGITSTACFRRTCQRSMWFNGKIVECRAFEQDLSPTSNNDH